MDWTAVYDPKVKRYAASLTGSEFDADDLIQEAALNLYAKQYKSINWHLVFRIILNSFITVVRRKKRFQTEYPDNIDTWHISDNTQQDSNEDIIRDLDKRINGLPSEQREVLALRFHTSLQHKEIAALTNANINTVIGRMRYGISAIKANIEKESNERAKPKKRKVKRNKKAVRKIVVKEVPQVDSHTHITRKLILLESYIQKNLAGNLNIDALSKIFGVPATTLKTRFKGMYGYSIGEYVVRAKMVRARKLLLSGKYKVAQVREKVDYSNPSHFNDRYKKLFGTTAREDQKRAEQKRK